jgi:hypothetical protein
MRPHRRRLPIFLAMLVAVSMLAAAVAWPEIRRSVTDLAVNQFVEQSVPLLAGWIRSARTQALSSGTTPVPALLRHRLATFYPDEMLDRVRVRVGLAPPDTITERLFQRFGKAVTLGDVIVFSDSTVAADPVIWAHEMAHVWQFERWGIDGFADHYLRDPQAVEREAWRLTGRWADIPPPAATTDRGDVAEVKPPMLGSGRTALPAGSPFVRAVP